MDDHDGQLDTERRALPFPAAERVDRSAVELHDLARNGQAQPKTAVCARGRTVGLAEALEQVREKILADTDT
jgi:hypothetical protein